MMNSPANKRMSGFPIYIIEGEEKSLVDDEVDNIITELLEPAQRDLGLLKIQGRDAVIGDCLDELRTLPFLATKRVVVVKDADKFISDNRQYLEDYFDNPSPTGVFVMTVNKLDKKTNLAKKLPKCGRLISTALPNRWTLPPYLIRYAEQTHSKKLGRQAAELIVELAGEDLGRLYREVDKLSAFTGSEKEITIENIQALTGHNRLFDAFEVFDEALAGRPAKATQLFRDMLAKERSAEYKIVGAFVYQVRRMFDAKVLLNKGTDLKEISGRLRIFGDRGTFFVRLKKMDLLQIGSLLELLGLIDYQVKTGQATIEVEMEKFILKLANKSGNIE
jgi:DNA polymerase III subunit delta